MKHQLFETWIFSDERLNEQQQAQLQTHLAECESCRTLAGAWEQVEAELKSAVMVAPAAGFTQRWLERLDAQDARVQRRQTLAMLAFSVFASVMLLASLLLLLQPVFDAPLVVLWAGVSRLMTLYSLFEFGRGMLGAVFQSFSGATSFIWLTVFTGVMTLLAVLWVVSYRLLTVPRRVTQ